MDKHKQSYKKSISTKVTEAEAFDKICRVSEWWAKNCEGKSKELDDVFTVRFNNGDMYKLTVTEIVPNTRIVWDVIDAYQGWHDDHTEWVGTHIIWEVLSQDGVTKVNMVHVGLVPEFECFEKCNQGWDYLLEKSLQSFLDTNSGIPV